MKINSLPLNHVNKNFKRWEISKSTRTITEYDDPSNLYSRTSEREVTETTRQWIPEYFDYFNAQKENTEARIYINDKSLDRKKALKKRAQEYIKKVNKEEGVKMPPIFNEFINYVLIDSGLRKEVNTYKFIRDIFMMKVLNIVKTITR